MVEIDLDFNKADVQRFSNTIGYLQTELGWSPSRAGKYAFIMLLKSVRASTKKSKTKRKVKVAGRKKKGFVGRREFIVDSYDKDGKFKPFSIFEGSLEEAKNSKFAAINRSGLAKQSWGWAMRDIFNTGTLPKVGFRRPSTAISGYAHESKGKFSAKVTNRLKYIRSAFRTSGDNDIMTAMKHAAKGMNEKIVKGLMKAGAEK